MTLPSKQAILVAAVAILAATLVSAQNSPTPAGQTVRGTVASITPTTLQLKTPSGVVSVAIIAPLTVYSREPSDLSQVRDSTFVGITSVKQPDGTQLATEVHIFAEALRGTGEGSYMMNDANGNPTSNRMTNGSVAAPRMTNGTVKSSGHGRTVTVDYGAGSQVIKIPPDVQVTAIEPIKTELTPGENVLVLATKTSSGAMAADRVLLITPSGAKK